LKFRTKTFLLFPILLILLSCSEDFDVNAKWKDITIVYGLLNPNTTDSIQYIKINKAFLNEKTSAIAVAQNIDSISYNDSLYVALKEYSGNNLIRTIELFKEYDTNKDSGIFSYPGQYLYRTSATSLSPNYRYDLYIWNVKTGKEITSTTPVVGNMSAELPRPNAEITFNPSSELDVRWFAGKNAYFYDLEIEINYSEYKKSDPTNKIGKVLHWPILSYRLTPGLSGGDEMKIKLSGASFYDFMAYHIPVDMSLEREFVGFNFIYSAGGQEIYYYIHVNEPSIGIIQKKPEYSNIVNGYGVYSSRNKNIIPAKLSKPGLTFLQSDSATINLNFVR
jgi:hypothetical protein